MGSIREYTAGRDSGGPELEGLPQSCLASDKYRGSPGEIFMDNQLIEEMIHDEQVKIDVRKAHLDLIILKYMAWRLHLSHSDHRSYLERMCAEPNMFQHIQVAQTNEKRWPGKVALCRSTSS